MNTYQVTLSERQAGLIARALDLWDRTKGGQFWELERALLDVAPSENHARISVALDRLQDLTHPHLGSGGGDFTFPGRCLAFNLRKVLEHGVAWDTRPLDPGSWGGVAYDGPIVGEWWEGEPPAVMLKWEGAEAVRIRDQANRESHLWGKLAEELGTEDIETAVRYVRALKKAAGQWDPNPGPHHPRDGEQAPSRRS